MTYSKKYYSKSNPNFLNLNEIKSETYNNNFQQNINLPYLKYFFERDIEELSSIHNDSDYDSYTLDNYEFKNNKIYDNKFNINRNSVYNYLILKILVFYHFLIRILYNYPLAIITFNQFDKSKFK